MNIAHHAENFDLRVNTFPPENNNTTWNHIHYPNDIIYLMDFISFAEIVYFLHVKYCMYKVPVC